jgi:hypothetical protein
MSWTVLVYMNADNDLEPFALEDLREMMSVGTSSSFRIVVEVDRNPGYDNSAIGGLGAFSGTKRVLVQKGALQQISDLGELDLAKPSSLSDFIAWGRATYPADRTALIFWDHGGGWAGFGVDETTAPGALLTIPEIESGLSVGLGSAKFDLLGFDACLMAGYETAATLAPFGDYLLASEDVEPGHGWDWHAFDLALQAPTSTPLQLGRRIILDYRSQASANKNEATATLSLVDLREVGSVKTALDGFISAVRSGGTTAVTALSRARDQARSYQSNSSNPQRSQYLYDLDSLAAVAAGSYQNLAASQSALSAAIQRAVKENFAGAAQAGSKGLTIYFPPSAAIQRPGYASVTATAAWQQLLNFVYAATTLRPTFTNLNHVATQSTDAQGNTVIQGTLAVGASSAISSALLVYGFVGTDGNEYQLGDEPAAFDSTSVSATWDRTTVILTQNSSQSYGYASFRASGSTLLLTVDFLYEHPAGVYSYAPRQLALEQGATGLTVASDTYYLQNGDAFGELVPAPGSKLRTIVKRRLSSGATDYVFGAAFAFVTSVDSSTGKNIFDLGLSFATLPSGTSAFAGLEIRNSAGEGDAVKASVAIP